MEDALSQSPSETSLWLHATAESDAEFARLSQTLAGLEGCSLEIDLDIKNSSYNQAIVTALRTISAQLNSLDVRRADSDHLSWTCS